MEDTDIICAVCQKPFLFSASEQAYYSERGFQLPKRCRGCRQARRKGGRRGAPGGPGGGDGGGGGGERREHRPSGRHSGRQSNHSGSGRHSNAKQHGRRFHPGTCAGCGLEMQLLFPAREREVRCADCFRKQYA